MTFRHLKNARGFFSDYYLGSILGQGERRGGRRPSSDRQTHINYARFIRIYERAEGRAVDASECRERFVRPLLRDVLGLHLGAGEDSIHRLCASADDEAAARKPLLLAYAGSWDENLDGATRRIQPTRKLETALARGEVRYGLLITGERARLIRAPGDGPRRAYLEVDLAGLAGDEDIDSFAVFCRIFSASSFLPDEKGIFPIDEIERESRRHAEKVSDDLKDAVFRAAESLVSALIEDSVVRGRIARPMDISEDDLRRYRDAALTALYRILFIFYAEARDPRLDEHELYRDNYSAQGLVDEIVRHPDRSWPENRCSFWERLRALFRIYDEGLPAITPWQHIPPRGGDFFSPETPAGKLLDEARLSDKAVARLILDLATSTPRRGIGRERVSFRELDIENLGAVYEGLLEYDPKMARETLFEITVLGRTYALAPSEIVRLREQKTLRLKGDLSLVRGTGLETLLPEETPGDDSPAEEADFEGDENDTREAKVESAEEGEEDQGIRKGAFASISRRLDPGSFYFIPGPGRKGTGSFYTPRALVRDIIRHAISPLIEGKTSTEIEKIRVLDPACGSAHFLVEAMRYIGQALHAAFVTEYGGKAPQGFRAKTEQGWDSDWQASDEEARAANSEARAWCKRRIAERCVFGVDLNPMAVSLARVALWIESVAGDRPLTYFEHHVRCGNSLLGTRMALLEHQSPTRSSRKGTARPPGIFQEKVREKIREAARLRRTIDEAKPEDLLREGIDPESVREQDYKDHLRRESQAVLAGARMLFDLRSASAFMPEVLQHWEAMCAMMLDSIDELERFMASQPWYGAFCAIRDHERFFHWELEFPEVLVESDTGGFDVVLGNPPWDKLLPNRHEFYGQHDILIRAYTGVELDRRISELTATDPGLAREFIEYSRRINTIATTLKRGGDYQFNEWVIDGKASGGHQDLSKYFVERAYQLARQGGSVGLVVPSALYNNEGCTGLRHMLLKECKVDRFYAFENRKKIFPIDSRYKFANLVFRKGKLDGDGFEAAFMRHELEELSDERPKPWMVIVRREELERMSPGTLAFLEYRSPRDREILLKMYEGHPLLGDQGPDTWNARFYTEFNMTNDRDLWTDSKTGKLWNPRQILGAASGTMDRPPHYEPAAYEEIRARMAEKGFWPLYEGKHIEQFLIDIQPIQRWVSLEAAKAKYGREPDGRRKVVFRDIASNTNERTCISAVLPERSCANHKLPCIDCECIDATLLSSILNSLSFDYSLRFRVSSNVTFTHISRVALPSTMVGHRATGLETQSAPRTGVGHFSELRELWRQAWDFNRLVIEAYGLTPEDFNYILNTFPVFARKRPEFFAYLKEQVAGWAGESQALAAGNCTVYDQRTPDHRRAAEAQARYKKRK